MILIIMLGLFIVVSKAEQRLLPNMARKGSYMAPILAVFMLRFPAFLDNQYSLKNQMFISQRSYSVSRQTCYD